MATIISKGDVIPRVLSDQAEMASAAYTNYNLYSATQYPWWCLNYFIGFWLLSTLASKFLENCPVHTLRDSYRSLDSDKQNNVVVYIMQFFGTSAALMAQLFASVDIIFRWQETTTEARLNGLIFSILLIVVLYIWELIYRKKAPLSLLLDHFIIILVAQLATSSFFDTHDIVYLRFTVFLGLHATVDQASFIALLLFRLNLCQNWQTFWFHFSAAQSLLVKTLVTMFSLAYYLILVQDGSLSTSSWGWFWKVSMVMLLGLLYAVHVYACWVLYKLGVRCQVSSSSPLQLESQPTIPTIVKSSSKKTVASSEQGTIATSDDI
ncbi:expressed unknown protein [Seminavis robusta]|uniref:Uncharacterized protein n=1 Tax=Seminavis robusta TaxID=568900 RepID=A0A9N8DSF3_9STRA|nr:expressed unknown protein [Seminavis robusta]|eukprot:Sro322_g117160.1 n/a (322) ;mRNA; f:72538-73503